MAGLRAKACRVGALSFLTGAQEPETLELVTGGPPGPDSTTLETEAPGGASGWRTMGVETSTRAERTAGPCAALRARASRSRFSRSSSDTVLGLGRGLHGAGAAARGMDAVQQACGPLPPSGQVLCFAAPWAGTLWVRQPGALWALEGSCRGSGSPAPAWSRAGGQAFLSRTTSMQPVTSIWNS